MSDDFSDDMTTESAEGGKLRANIYLKSDYYDVSTKSLFSAYRNLFQGFMTINGKRLKKADIKADNGVIHMMTDVIYPISPTKSIAQFLSSDPRYD